MIHHGPHENDALYGWTEPASDPSDPESFNVPTDLMPYYRQFKPGYWGFVCPSCHTVYPPGLGGMPRSFRAHIQDHLQGKGCFFNPKK